MEFFLAVFWSEKRSKNITILYATNNIFSIAPIAFMLPPIKPPIPKIYFGLTNIIKMQNIHDIKILKYLQKL